MSSGVSSAIAAFDQSQLIQITQFMGDMQQQSTFGGSNDAGYQAAAEAQFANEQQFFAIAANDSTGAAMIKQQQGYMAQQQGGESSGDQANQVHTIILNGQPALFIPASAAMSSSLLCQMMMNNATTAPMTMPQNGLELGNVPQSNGASSYEFIQFPSTDGANSAQNNQPQQQFIQVDQLFNGAFLASDMNQQPNGAAMTCSNGNPGQMAFIQLPTKQAQPIGGQQLLCLSNDDLMNAFQQPMSQGQETSAPHQSENHDAAKLKPKCAHILPAPEGGRKIPPMVKTTTPKKPKGPTVASVLASSNSLNYMSSGDMSARLQTSKQAKCNKVSSILNESRPKQTVINETMHQAQQLAEQSIQFIFLNTTNMTASSNPPAAAVANKPDEADRAEQATSSPSKEDKKKRKACECPNCIRWRSNLMTEEELKKRRTHRCHKCVKEYNKTSHLRAHLRAHDGYRPFVCEHVSCGKSFTRSDELKRHSRIHNDDRNFTCPTCNKKFLRSDHLNKHVLVHAKPASGPLFESSSPAASPLSSSSSSFTDEPLTAACES